MEKIQLKTDKEKIERAKHYYQKKDWAALSNYQRIMVGNRLENWEIQKECGKKTRGETFQ